MAWNREWGRVRFAGCPNAVRTPTRAGPGGAGGAARVRVTRRAGPAASSTAARAAAAPAFVEARLERRVQRTGWLESRHDALELRSRRRVPGCLRLGEQR